MRHARGKCGRAVRMDLVGQPSHTDAAIESVNESEKNERDCEKREPELAKRAARAHGNEEIKTEDGGRKNERKCDDGFDEKFCAKFGKGQPVGERRRENKKNHGDEKGEAKGEEEFGHGVGRGFIWEWDGQGIRAWRNRISRGWLGLQEI